MQKVICDTMIWYEIGRGTIDVPNRDIYKLVCTYASMNELALSPNATNNLSDVKNAIGAIFKSKPEIIVKSPIEHFIKSIGHNLPYDEEFRPENDAVMIFLRQLSKQTNASFKKGSFRNWFDRVNKIRRANLQSNADFLNELYDHDNELRRIFKKHHDFNNNDVRTLMLNDLKHNYEIDLDVSEVDWSLIELYEKTYSQYLKRLIISRQKASANDSMDLANLLYVQPGILYWTKEKRWISMIQDAKMDKYLFKE